MSGIPRHIADRDGFVVMDSRGCGIRELFENYEAFGLLCASGRVRRALLKIGDEDAEAHYALRDILLTIARTAEVPLAFRLALVATADATARVCRTMRDQLNTLGCEARVFRLERLAEQWLRAGAPQAQRTRAEAAIV